MNPDSAATMPSLPPSRKTRATWRASAAGDFTANIHRIVVTHHGQTHRLHRISPRTSDRPRAGRAHRRLEGIPFSHGGGKAPPAGRPLHGLRHSVLSHRHVA